MLIRRISNLEQRIADLSVDCERITEHRSEIAPVVLRLQLQNVAMVQEVSGLG